MAHTLIRMTAEDNDKRALNFSAASNVNMGIAILIFTDGVEDQSGNYVIVDRTVVVDTTPPEFNLAGPNPYTVEAADGSIILILEQQQLIMLPQF